AVHEVEPQTLTDEDECTLMRERGCDGDRWIEKRGSGSHRRTESISPRPSRSKKSGACAPRLWSRYAAEDEAAGSAAPGAASASSRYTIHPVVSSTTSSTSVPRGIVR